MSDEVRKLAAIMFTDIVGYSALTQKNEAIALDLLKLQNEILRPVISAFRGIEIKTIGDAFLIEFVSALDSVNCAVEMQKMLRDYNSAASIDRNIHIRIGIHVGDVVHRENDVFGDGVNIASRIEPLAKPGGICITQQVFDQIHNKIEEPIRSLGTGQLKNITVPLKIYRIVLPWEKKHLPFSERVYFRFRQRRTRRLAAGIFGGLVFISAAWWLLQPSLLPTSVERSIAVLPFLNLSSDKDAEYIGDGITEETITTLAQLPTLQVTPLTTVMTLKGSKKTLEEISQLLHVSYVMEGSIRKSGQQIRVVTRLFDPVQGKTIWTKTFDQTFSEIFNIQSQVAREVATLLQIQLSTSTQIGRKYQPNSTAYTYYLKGTYLRRKFNLPGLEEAKDQYERAIKADPKFADAYVQLASVYASMVDISYTTDPIVLLKADSLLTIARQLDPEFSPYDIVVGFVSELRGDKRNAEVHYRAGLSKDSSIWYGHSVLGWLLHTEGREEEAIKAFDGALRADPTAFTPHAGKASAFCALGQYNEALLSIDEALRSEPQNAFVINTKIEILLQKGDVDAAARQIQQLLKVDSVTTSTHILFAQILAMQGNISEAWQQWKLGNIVPNQNVSHAYAITVLYAAEKNVDSAFTWLTRMVGNGFSQDEQLRHDVRLTILRGDTRFEQIIGKAAENRLAWFSKDTH